MKFTISEVFCEVVSAIGFVFALLPILICLDLTSLEEINSWVRGLTGTQILSLTFVAYVLGVFLNIIGLPMDEILKRIRITGQEPSAESSKKFYKNASSDLFAYRTNAWNHYYCFRNLLTFYPLSLFWLPVIYQNFSAKVFTAAVVAMLITAAVLYYATKLHAEFYLSVTNTFD